jgi:hypothetical protein
MKKFALEKLRSQSSLAFVAAILGFVFLAGAFLKASTPSQLYPVFLFDGIPQNFWSGVVFGVISLELILGTMLITAFYLKNTLRLSGPRNFSSVKVSKAEFGGGVWLVV